jgi:membrane-associated phospholipid phosphatase
LPLYGGGLPDVLACAIPLVVATGVSVLRLAADRHYASDVIVGALAGFGGGFGLPTLLHYGGGAAKTVTLVPSATEEYVGIAMRAPAF